nr:leukotoxin LktA family filamentous adhesin [Mitsuokella multacida]
MSYTRYTNRKNERASDRDAVRMTRTEENQLTHKVLSALLAAGLVMSPTAVDASVITDTNKTYAPTNEGIYNIYAQKRHDKIAINEFEKFQLDANHIANLYFRTQDGKIDAENLLNFVNTRIDINGTLNAIKNGKIGGNLFFLSPEGMAVGKSGVINTGALYVMAPATTSLPGESNYESLKDVFNTGAATEEHLNAIKNGSPLIPLNPSGTISVLGKINAADDVKLYAAQIAVGRNLTGEAIDGTAAGGIKKTAAIETGVTDFASLVNLSDDQKTAAGLGNLQATQTGNGDIVLAARAEYANAYDKAFNDLGKLAGLLGTTETPEINVPKTITASVENYGTIKTSTATGDVVLKAEATNGNKDHSASDASAFAQTVADVKVQGDVKAAGQVELTAKADNTYVDSGKSVTDKLGDTLSYVVPVGANVMILDNKASVTVEKEAQVEGSQVAISAEANLDGTAGVTAAGRKLVSKVPSAIPAVGVGYAKATNEATVQIDGKVKATGADTVDDKDKGNVNKALQIKANAQSAVDHSASTTVKKGALGAGSASLAAAVAITDHKNDATVNLNGTAEAEQGSASVTADTVHKLNTSATAKAADETVGTAAVDVVVHASTSAVDVQGTVNAKNDVTIKATNTTDENTHVSNNNLGMGKLQAKAMQAADLTGISNKVKENKVVSGILSKLQKDGGNTDVPLSTTLGQTLSAGAAVTVTDETNKAKVNIGSKAFVQAGQELTAKAESKVYDTMMTASGTTSSFKNSDNSSDTVTIATGVVYAGMDNQADVTVADGTDDQHATLQADGNLNLQSSNIMEYHRPERMKREIDRSIEKLDTAITAIENMPESKVGQGKEILEQLEKLKTSMTGMVAAFTTDYLQDTSNVKNLTAEGTLNKIGNVAGTGWEILNAVTKIQQSVGQLQDVTSPFGEVVTNALAVVTNAVAFTEPNQYANVSAAAVSRGGSDTKASLAAAVTATDFDYGSHVTVGKHASLTAGNALNLKAEEVVKDVNITGKNKVWKNDAEAVGGVGIGGSVNYQNFDTDTLVKVDKGAALTAGDMELVSSSDIFHTGVMLSAGKAEGSAISGMLAMTDSDSKNQTLVDKDAVLKAGKDAGKNHQGSIAITGYNDTNVNNAILSLSAGSGAAAAGIAAAINKVDVVNRAAVENIDAADDDEKSGSIEASKLGVSAETTGLINTISVAGGVTASGKDPEKAEADKGPLDKLGDGFGKLSGITDTINGKINQVSNKVQDVIGTVNGAGASQGGTLGSVPTKSETAPSFALAGAGSVSLNMVSDDTQAIIDGANVKLENDGTLEAGARDTSFVGAFSGGAAISMRKGQSQGTSAAFSGAVGVNKIDNTIGAVVKNSTITGLKNMKVTALSGSTSVAAGTGLSLIKNSQPGNNFAGGASVSVNLIDKDVTALAENNTVSGVSADGKADVKLTAYESDLQVTGGVNANVATGGGTAVGGSITVADIDNNLDARIHGGSYTNIHTADAESLLATRQITAAISTGVAVGGNGTNNAFTGAMIYNGLHNDVKAGIDGGARVTADTIAIRAHDTTSGSAEAKPYQDLLGDYRDHQQFAEDAGIDTDGSSYYKDSYDKDNKDDRDAMTAGEAVDYDGNRGSLSVGAAFVVAGSSGNAAGAAVNVANLDNDFTAAIDKAVLTADSVSVNADADSLAVNVSAGVAAGAKDFGGMGSVTWQDQDNRIQSQVTDSDLTTNNLEVKASSNAQAVNVAGSVAYGKTAGVGAALAYNGLDNHIGAYLAGGSVTAKGADGAAIEVAAQNTGKVYGIGAAVAAGKDTALSGTVAVNHGGSDTEAVIGETLDDQGSHQAKDTVLTNAKSTEVQASSSDYRLAVAGGVSASGKVAIGGAVAYNDVGGASASTEDARQKTRAALVSTILKNIKNGTVAVNATDTSTLTTVGVGVGGAGKVAVQGAAATALVNKAVSAEVRDSFIDKDKDQAAVVNVEAAGKSKITSTALAGAGSGNAAVGAGVAVNRINQDTAAAVSDSTLQGKNITVQATGNSAITSVGIGGAAAGKLAVAGNIAVNQIGNHVTAAVKNSSLTNTGNIVVMANGRENLGNYAGALSVAAGGQAGVGMGVSYNAITGTTASQVFGSTLTSKGQEPDSVPLTSSMDSDGVKVGTDTRKGVVVASYGQHDLQSVALTAGAAVSGDVGVGAAGTVTVNKIGGATEASLTNTTVNANHAAGAADDISVNAKDKTESESHVGSLSVGIGASTGGAGVSAASDTLVFDRTTKAELSGSDKAKATVNGRTIDVKAGQASDVVTNADGLAVSGGTYGAGSAAATAAATKLSGSTQALVKNITSQNAGLSVGANHNHKTTLVSASAAVSAAIASGAIGAGIGVVNDDFNTTAELSGSTITTSRQDGLTDSGRVSVTADSASEVDTHVLGVAGSVVGAGVTVAVNNLNSTSSALVGSSDVKADDALTVDAHNKVKTEFNSIQAAAGGAAIATGIGINTIDTGTAAQVTGSKIVAKTAAVNAREELDVNQTMAGATVGGMGFDANVMVTTIGTAIADSYGSPANNGASFNTASVLENANKAMDAQQSGTSSSSDTVKGALHNETTGIDVQDDSGVQAGNGTSTGKGTQVSVTDSTINTGEELALSADRQTDAQVTAASASLTSTIGMSATVAVLDADKKAGITVEGSNLTAGTNLSAQARQHGETAIDAYQAGLSGAAKLSAAYAQSSSSGSTAISLKNSTLTAADAKSGNIAIQAEDTGATRSSVTGVTAAGLISGGALITKAENDSDTSVTLDGTTLTGKGAVSVESSKANIVSAKTLGGAAGAMALQGVVAAAEDKGSSTVALTGTNVLSGKELALTAKSTPQVVADATAYSGALVGAGGASVATAKVGGKIQLTAAQGSSFTGDRVALSAFYGQQGDASSTYKNAKAKAIGNAAAIGGTIQANVATAEQDTEVSVDLGKSTYNADNLTIEGNNAAALDATAKGVAIGGYFASGTNIANLTGNLATNVAAKGATEGSALGTVRISSSGFGDLSGSADGTGGGLVTISPWAAKAKSALTTDTTTSISGGWQAGSMEAVSANSDDVDVTADSLSASVIGASGTQLDTTVHHKAQTDVTGSVVSSGRQCYTAANAVNHDVDLKGSGYGGASVNANTMTNDLSYTAKVNLNQATLKGTGEKGSITAEAVTTGKMDYLNHLQSAGVIPVTVASSKNTIAYDNSINVENSTLTTAKADQDITFAATDDTTSYFKTVADTQGGVVGAASSESENKLTRSNKIAVSGGKLESMNDVNLYAGADAAGLRSILNYNVFADAYNKTAIPLSTSPKVNNEMLQANQVDIDGTVRSVRHTNLKAGKGLTIVAESAREYNIYTGTSGKGSLTSTALGEQSGSEQTDNKVHIGANGSVTAGIHTDLDVTIDGTAKFQDDKTNPTISGIDINVNKGADWYNSEDITVMGVTIKNNLAKRYRELNDQITQYPSNSNEYRLIKAELDGLRSQMIENGFMGTQDSFVSDERTVAAVALPDAVVSGGNVVIDADSVEGNGSLTAKGANLINIENKSDLYMQVGDVIIKDKGGQILYNDSLIKNAAGLEKYQGTVTSSSLGGSPEIVIKSSGPVRDTTSPDIGIVGTVQNSEGKVTVENVNANIFVDSDATISGRDVALKAPKGSITQFSDGWLMVGTDPITRYQFNDSIAGKIQTFFSQNVANYSFSSYDEYLNFLLSGLWSYEECDDKGSLTSPKLVRTYEEFKDVCARAEAKHGSIKINAAVSNLGFTNDELDTILAAKNAVQKDSGAGIQAGQNVYLYGKNVIIDGLVQSGYDSYTTTLTEKPVTTSKITWTRQKTPWGWYVVLPTTESQTYASQEALLEAQWQEAGKPSLTDSQVLGNAKYLVNDGGSRYNADRGVWEYEVKVYYNPSTGKLPTENITPSGGKIYITGALASTNGNGRLVAMDGTPTISIDSTQVDKDLVVGTIRNQDLDGLISIKDTNKNTLTEYRNNNGVITAETTPTDGQGTSTSNVYAGGSAMYQPAAQTLKWTGGTSGDETIKKMAYTKNFTLWSLVKYRTTDEFIKSINTSTGKLETTTSYRPSGTLLGQSTLITSGGQEPEYQSSTAKPSGATTRSEVVETKKYNNWTHFAGQITYSWTETTPSSTSSTYSIHADKPIEIGFLQGKNDAITIAGSKNVDLVGNITSAGSGGTVTLASKQGSIEAQTGAVINTDNLTASALQDISLNHSALGDTANISLTSDKGSVTLLSGDGKLNIKEASVKNGNLYLQADGDLQSAAGTVLTGNRIDLVSRHGAIAADVAAATEPLDSDPMSASINAQAEGNITLKNSNGTMCVGHIISNSGDVNLTTNGSFEDAVGNGTLSGSSDKMALWKEMGLVSDADADDSHTAAAAASKKERLDALTVQGKKLAAESESKHALADYEAEAFAYATYAAGSEELQAAKKAYETKVKALKGETSAMTEDERQAAFDEAFKSYDEARKAYFEGKDYTAEEQDFILNYSEVENSDAYGWSRNDLLYAIQDSVLNAAPEDEVVTVDTPNIKGRNIVLNAGLNIGVDDAAKAISYDDLTKVENLQLLSQAKAGDLTWKDDSVVVKQQKPLTVELDGGKLTLNANQQKAENTGNIYIAGVKDTVLDVTGKIKTTENVKLMSDNGVKMTEGGITANNLIITGGKGDVGSDAHKILTNLSGTLDARTAGDIYLHQTGLDGSAAKVLTIQNVAGRQVNLASDAGMVMTTEQGKTAGYINGEQVSLVSSAGSLGLADDAIRVKNSGILSADAQNGNIYIAGKEPGTLTLNQVNGKDEFILQSEGTVQAGSNDADTPVESSIQASKVKINSAASTLLNNGSLNADILNLTAGGSVKQSAAHAITAKTASMDAAAGISLNSGAEAEAKKFNAFKNVTLKNASDAADVVLGNSGDEDLKVTFAEGSKAKNVTVRNYKNGVVNDLTVNGPVTAAEGISLINDEADLRTTGAIDSAADVEMTTVNGDIEVGGTTRAAQDIRAAAKTGQIRFVGDAEAKAGSLQAQTDVGDISFEGQAASGTDLTAETTDGSISFEGQATSGKDLTAKTTHKGDITFAGLVNADRNLIADAAQTGTITLRKDVTAKQDVNLHTHDGSMVFDGSDAGKTEDIHLTAQRGNIDLRTTGTGDIEDSRHQENGDRAFVNATNGNVVIHHEGTGDVDLYGLYAKKEAATELKNGSLYLDTMDGDLVAMFVRNPDKVMDVKHITAGQEIAVAGADIGIDDILQREGADNLLTITPTGASDDAPIQNLHIGNIRTNEGSGIRFKHLWLENGDISVSKGQFLIDKLYVLGKATFSNGVMVTNVFGTAPVYEDGVTSAYWNNTAINDPKEALAAWLNGAPDEHRWMFLRFYGQTDTQYSNGNLLDLVNHYHVYRQRYTETDWMRMMENHDRYDFYRTYYHPALSLHDRFGLVDASNYLDAFKNPANAVNVAAEEREKA